MLVGRLLRLCFHPLSAIPCKKFLKIVAVRPVSSERILIEQSLDAATRAHLVGAALGANGPAHLAVPASPKNYGSSCKTRRHQPDRPQPPRTLAPQRLRFVCQLPPNLVEPC